jgi:hypothetical protein
MTFFSLFLAMLCAASSPGQTNIIVIHDMGTM